MSATKAFAMLAFVLAAAACAGRQIYYPRGCEERLESPYKRAECRACVERPVRHVFLPDEPDGARCARQ
jgi:hypothetical protein